MLVLCECVWTPNVHIYAYSSFRFIHSFRYKMLFNTICLYGSTFKLGKTLYSVYACTYKYEVKLKLNKIMHTKHEK